MTSSPATCSPDGAGPRRGPTRPVRERTMPELLQAQVRATPHATALLGDGEEVCYQELDRRANRLAHLLIGLGAGPENRVGVALPRSVDAIVALVAVVKTGAAYLPLNPEHPRERLAFMVRDAAPAVVLTGPGTVLGPKDVPGSRLLAQEGLDTSPYPETAPTDADRTRPLRPENPLYLIYTSGSTGVPKGVLMPARSLVNLLAWHKDRFPLPPGARVANLSAIGFDMAMHEILAPLVHGRCLAVPAERVRRDPVELARWLRRHRVHQVFLPNVLIESLCEAAEVAGVRLDDLTDIVQSGEPLALGDTVRRFLRAHPRLRIHNHYGATEMQDATVWTTGPEPHPSPAPIGTPLWNVGVYVLDDALRPVAAGTPGNLHVAGAGLARGYLDRPAMTADRFRPDPFGPPGSRMYRTGDLARWNEHGELVCLGRSDNQVKLNGFRVELGEIEARLLAHPAVGKAVVLPREDTAGRRRVVAYVLAAPGAEQPEGRAVRRDLRQNLPAHMVPAAVVVLDAFPLSPNGKIDLLALPSPPPGTGGAAAETPGQKIMAAAFAEVFGEEVGVDDDFFELGGDSVAAIRVVIRARRDGIALGPQDVFDLGTPRRLAARSDGAAGPPAARHLPVRPLLCLSHAQLGRLQAARPDLEQVLPVSPLQQGLLFHRLRDGEGADSYAEQILLRLTGPLDAAALRTAAGELLARHDALRTAFFTDGMPEPVQCVVRDVELPWRESDLSGPARPAAAAEARRLAAADRQLPFDLSAPPLVRFRLVRLAADEHRLTIDFHHVLLDGWSTTLLVRELFARYRGDGGSGPAPSARPWLRVLRSRDGEAAAGAWREALDGIAGPTVLVPGGNHRPDHRGPATADTDTAATATCTVDLPPDLTARLTQVTRRNRLTVHLLVGALWGVLLGAETGTRDVVFGTTDSGRTPDVPGVEDLVGMLVNTVPLAVRLRPEETVLDLLQRLRQEQQRVAQHQSTGLGEVRRLMGWTREFDTLLVVENPALQVLPADVAHAGLRLAGVDITDGTHYAVSLLATPGERLRLSLTHRRDLVGDDRARSLAEGLCGLLAAVADDPHQRVGQLPAAGADRSADRAGKAVSPMPAST